MITFPLPPSSNRYWRNFRGRMVVSAAATQYKADVAILGHVAGVECLAGPVCVWVNVYRQRRAGDLDNYLKILLDALQGVLYENDAQVIEIHATLADDKNSPRCEVTVSIKEI